MPLYGIDIYEKDMYPAIWNMFHRYYQRGYLLKKPYVYRPHATRDVIPDAVYIRAYNEIHVVEAKRYAGYVDAAIAQLKQYRGNFKYIALPDGEYFDNDEFVNDAIDRRFGIILVGLRGRGFSADFFSVSPRYFDNCIRCYE